MLEERREDATITPRTRQPVNQRVKRQGINKARLPSSSRRVSTLAKPIYHYLIHTRTHSLLIENLLSD